MLLARRGRPRAWVSSSGGRFEVESQFPPAGADDRRLDGLPADGPRRAASRSSGTPRGVRPPQVWQQLGWPAEPRLRESWTQLLAAARRGLTRLLGRAAGLHPPRGDVLAGMVAQGVGELTAEAAEAPDVPVSSPPMAHRGECATSAKSSRRARRLRSSASRRRAFERRFSSWPRRSGRGAGRRIHLGTCSRATLGRLARLGTMPCGRGGGGEPRPSRRAHCRPRQGRSGAAAPVELLRAAVAWRLPPRGGPAPVATPPMRQRWAELVGAAGPGSLLLQVTDPTPDPPHMHRGRGDRRPSCSGDPSEARRRRIQGSANNFQRSWHRRASAPRGISATACDAISSGPCRRASGPRSLGQSDRGGDRCDRRSPVQRLYMRKTVDYDFREPSEGPGPAPKNLRARWAWWRQSSQPSGVDVREPGRRLRLRAGANARHVVNDDVAGRRHG